MDELVFLTRDGRASNESEGIRKASTEAKEMLRSVCQKEIIAKEEVVDIGGN